MISEQQRWAMDHHYAATGQRLTEARVEAAGVILNAAQRRLSPKARVALRRGPAAYREFLADRDDRAARA
ncbi:hypothetical protein GKC29_15000 [Micromonospora sp. WMMC415]|uniref:hypothetical protein n=1 Tax=Micromonospora sp. WMMC415 TaxID=2675222 RepID=UPI0012B4A646|nr:hypothetical protein [Micromonospora sp. WMMC415]QGN48021.1 hypothetical protein GKC29_15000 [Micromonospora sp. WMMC415]